MPIELAEDLHDLLDSLGQDALWRPASGGEPRTVRVLLPGARLMGGGSGVGWYAQLYLLAADVPGWATGDVFETGGRSWRVRPSPAEDIAAKETGDVLCLRVSADFRPGGTHG